VKLKRIGIHAANVGVDRCKRTKSAESADALERPPNNLSGRVDGKAKENMYNFPYIPSRALTMDAITYTSARANLAQTMDRVCNDHEPLIITRSGEQAVVMLALDDFKALEETAYLLRSPSNARRLLAAMLELEAGKGKARKLTK
jgi:antitoxin YefM